MDQPFHILPGKKVMCCTSIFERDEDEGELTPLEKMEDVLARDDSDVFVKVAYCSKWDKIPFCILRLMFGLDAVNCVAAVLNGEISTIDVNAIFCYTNKESPLHRAAFYSSQKIAQLFLDTGANPDLRCDLNDTTMKRMLPIDVLHARIGSYACIFCWTPGDSIFRLLFRLTLPDLRDALETLRVLAPRMNELDGEITRYVREGKLVELAALLIAVPDKVMGSFISTGNCSDGIIKIRDFVLAEIAFLERQIISSTGCNKSVKEYKNKKVKMVAMLQLLEIFERVGSYFEAYLRLDRSNENRFVVARELTWLFENAGYDIKLDLMDDANRYASGSKSEALNEVDCSSRHNWKPGSIHTDLRPHSLWNPKKQDNFLRPVGPYNQYNQITGLSWVGPLRSVKANSYSAPAYQVQKSGTKMADLQLFRLCLTAFRRGIKHA